jgi:hypothetical protein
MTDDTRSPDERSLTEVLEEQVRAERELSRSLADYKGKWVGVRDHVVVADADSLEELMNRLEDDRVDVVFEVPEVRASAVFF